MWPREVRDSKQEKDPLATGVSGMGALGQRPEKGLWELREALADSQ